ncbi:hypothetical protein CCHR01_01013 [Colletotrichum chrysophilum]|uniref:Uncharacterized protein n=1 Tax=Colletotrichum chrysophilum TaxID=1836956 RepID=A0AAD9ETT8_9PEZI|nr:hypothetical protein CCHR01_01013 [Colletotrichum chrysophilum]
MRSFWHSCVYVRSRCRCWYLLVPDLLGREDRASGKCRDKRQCLVGSAAMRCRQCHEWSWVFVLETLSGTGARAMVRVWVLAFGVLEKQKRKEGIRGSSPNRVGWWLISGVPSRLAVMSWGGVDSGRRERPS